MQNTSKLDDPVKTVDLIGCPDCSRSYLQKNIYRHLWNQHNWSKEECKQLVSLIKSEKKVANGGELYNCEFCGVNFKSIQTMMRHRRVCASAPATIHQMQNEKSREFDEIDDLIDPDSYLDDEEDPPPDLVGPSTSTSHSSDPRHQDHSYILNEHPVTYQRGYSHEDYSNEVEVYDTDPLDPQLSVGESIKQRTRTLLASKYRTTSNICPKCQQKCESCEEMVLHCRKFHETPTTKFRLEQKAFKTYNDFKKWFDQRQEDSCTSLTKRTGHGGETFYRCHMIGKYSSIAKKRRASTRKLDQSCTAFLKVIVHSDGSTIACGSFDHIGHELNHKMLWLTETQEKYVKELIDLGWSSDQIYFYIREEYDNYECKLKYISKNDIRNISVRYERLKSRNPEDYRVEMMDLDGEKAGEEGEEYEQLKNEPDNMDKQMKLMRFYAEKAEGPENAKRHTVVDRIDTIKRIRQMQMLGKNSVPCPQEGAPPEPLKNPKVPENGHSEAVIEGEAEGEPEAEIDVVGEEAEVTSSTSHEA